MGKTMKQNQHKVGRWIPLALLASLVFPGGTASSQETVFRFRQGNPGWIGLQIDYGETRVAGSLKRVAIVGEVLEDSPAESAGLLVGDTLTQVDGQDISPDVFAFLSRTLEPGDLVRLSILRGGEVKDVMVEAAAAPTGLILAPDANRMVVELEALGGNILRNLDSLRLSIAGLAMDPEGGDVSVHILRVPGDASAQGEAGYRFSFQTPFGDSIGSSWGQAFFSPEVQLPFEAWVVGSQATQRLQEELNQVRENLTSLRRQEEVLRQELATTSQRSVEEALQQDDRLRQIKDRETRLLSQQDTLMESLRRVSEEEIQRQWITIQSQNEEGLLRAREAQRQAMEEARQQLEETRGRSRFRYEYPPVDFTSPVMMGQSFILGAQLAPLNPQLARYFPVKEGVVVVQVVDGTPASDAGLQGGDIIVAIGAEDVASLSDLRLGLASAQGPYTIRVVRQDGPVEIVIRRQPEP
jgi:hypothetical protein